MKKRQILERAITRQFLLREAEDDEDAGGEDAGGEDLFGDTEEDAAGATEEPAGDEADEEEGEDDKAAEDEDAGEDEEKDSEAEDVEPASGGSIVDSEIEAVLIDFETKALGKAISKGEQVASESAFYKGGLGLLLEAEGPKFDIDVYSSEVARLVKNYQNLIDMESILIGKAISFVKEKYGEDAAKEVESNLIDKHDLSLTGEKKEEIKAPIAVGAMPGGGGG